MQKSKSPRTSILLILLALVLAITSTHPAVSQVATPWRLRASFIDVGQGDSALLQDPGGCNVLIDGGSPGKGQVVVAYLRDHGVTHLDAMIATHADSDHYGGLTGVLQAADISTTAVLYNGYANPASSTWNLFVAAVVSRGLTLTVAGWPTAYSWCAMTAQALNPDPLVPFINDNDASLVLLAQSRGARMLFTGDATSIVEPAIISRSAVGQFPVDVLKVSHHGSKYATSSEFLSVIKSQRAVISVGVNSYGHPATETLQRLDAAGAIVYRTDISGTIVLESEGAYTTTLYLPLVR
ncbi:MAG TPA: MBL fold metallo-hydrolase [Anaerolineae bacterium]|jgi:beta-lactamase superfamily II metal-dependent hydrolase